MFWYSDWIFSFLRNLVAVEDYLSQLNDAQQQPTTHVDGPLMVIAGAGSGKTRVLTYRIAYLMQQGIERFPYWLNLYQQGSSRNENSNC